MRLLAHRALLHVIGVGDTLVLDALFLGRGLHFGDKGVNLVAVERNVDRLVLAPERSMARALEVEHALEDVLACALAVGQAGIGCGLDLGVKRMPFRIEGLAVGDALQRPLCAAALEMGYAGALPEGAADLGLIQELVEPLAKEGRDVWRAARHPAGEVGVQRLNVCYGGQHRLGTLCKRLFERVADPSDA